MSEVISKHPPHSNISAEGRGITGKKKNFLTWKWKGLEHSLFVGKKNVHHFRHGNGITDREPTDRVAFFSNHASRDQSSVFCSCFYIS